MVRRLFLWLFPGLVPGLLLAWLLKGHVPGVFARDPWLTLVMFAPPGLLVAGWVLSVYFHSSRLRFLSLFLVRTYMYVMACDRSSLFCFEVFGGVAGRNSQLAFPLLIPLNFLLVHGSRETGLFTVRGLWKWVIVGGQFLLLIGIFSTLPGRASGLIDRLPVYPAGGVKVLLPSVFLGGVLLFVYLMRGRETFYDNFMSPLFWCMTAATVPFFNGVGHYLAGGIPFHVPVLYVGAAALLLLKTVNLAWSKAYRDPLTQIPGRIALDEALERLSGQYVVVMIDIDEFKDFNDTYGHDAGDKVLKQVAYVLERETSGRAYRFGGEEFTLIYPGRTLPQIEDELETIRKTVAANKVEVTRKSKRATKILERRVTISLGASQSGERFTSAEEVLNAADNALFKAKDEGRNCVEYKE